MTALGLYFMRPKVKANFSTAAMFIILVWTSVNSIMFDLGGGIGFNSDQKVSTVAMYMAVSVLSFRHFREKLLKALTCLSAVTLIAWSLHIGLGIGRFGTPPAPTFGIFMDWGGRMASIYWEPGQYQIIMTSTLVLFFDELRQIRFANIMRYVRRFGIIVLAIIVCRSTMGYLCLMVLMVLAFMSNKSAKNNKIMYIFLLIVAVILAVVIFNSDVVQEKIDPRNLSRRSSLYTRMWDSIALWNMSLVSPITGIGFSSEFQKYGRMYYNTTASNGWLGIAAEFGWPFLLFVIWCVVRNLKRMKFGLPAIIAFIPLFMTNSNEFWILYPILYIYIFRFRDYAEQHEKSRALGGKH